MPTESKDDLSMRDVAKQIEELKQDKIKIDEDLRRTDGTEKRILEQRRRNAENLEPATSSRPKDGDKDEKEKEEKDDKRKEGGDKDKEVGADKKDGDEEKGKQERENRKRDNDGRPKVSDRRSKALFGKMLGHLQSAKSRLDTEREWKSTKLQMKAQERLNEKMLLSQVNIADYKKESFDKHRQEQAAKMSHIDKAIEAKELLLCQKRLEGHYSLMMNFIRTKAEPTIFYLPAKHIKSTEAELEETRSAIKRKITSLKIELQPEDADDDKSAARRSAAAAAAAAADGSPRKAGSGKGSSRNGSDAEDDAKEANDDEDDKKNETDNEPAKKNQKKEKDGSGSGDETNDSKSHDEKHGKKKIAEKDGSDGSDDN